MGVERVERIFREVFGDAELKIFPEMTARDVANWDSFNHINLIVALEGEFRISFATEEIIEMLYVDDLIKLLQEKGHDVSW